MVLIKHKEQKEIYKLLLEFDDCFPHLKEKIEDLEKFAYKLSKNAITIEIIEDNISLGMAAFYANDTSESKVGYLTLIGIKTEFRGMHLGKLLLNTAIDEMKALGMKCIKLEVDNDNLGALGFYKHHGFNENGEKKENSIILEKTFKLL